MPSPGCPPACPPGRRAVRGVRDESGVGLVEVIVSTLLVVLVASGVYLGLDAASATSGVNKHRSLASGIAQQDQDRMRAMAVTELSNYRDTRTTTVAAVTYTVTSHASWVTDSTGTAACTRDAARAHYLRISSAVTWPSMRIAPVAIESIVAPPNGSFGTDQGALAVQVHDRDGAPVPGVAVTLAGARSYTDVTNDAGCVLWGYLPVGNYTVSLAKPGYVDRASSETPAREVGVVGEATNTVAFEYDRGGRIEARYGAPSATGWQPSNGLGFAASNTAYTVPLQFGDGLPHPSFTTGLLFPFAEGYGVYAGNCAAARPDQYAGQVTPNVAFAPGETAVVELPQPRIDVRAVNGAQPVAGATVKATATGPGCGALPPRITGADGYVTDRGFPYGPYSICVQGVVGGRTRARILAVENTSLDGVPATAATFDLATASAGSSCP